MDSHQDQDSPAEPDPHEPQYEEFDAVNFLVRGGYPIEREELFAFTKKLASDWIAKGVPTIVPSSKDDPPIMLKLMDDLLRYFPDLECSAIGNPADPKKWTYFIATDQGRYVDVPLAEYRDMVRRQDFWNPEPKLRLQETIADAEVRDLLQKIGARLHPFRTVFWD
ncbi:uncharacterized protein SCHCODRAFT_02617789 [Schizophyllum commune H4-8]|uniref:uncharacterized protein n=1 Tax=Schizophyllum commune (strain H4-8 / FGSC 9210) TaxID=578458 RepID=UPI00215E1EBB|nr:uncharacterized protein SCHCODRAFT_02617789 [Schizophyllum commune H4-8]KAI5894779.1 hypothetical protein SCHCODRAFT_02617789 [Schizophyllum commune H4-8]